MSLNCVGAGKPTAVYFIKADRFCETFFKYTYVGIVGIFNVFSLAFVGFGATFYFMRNGYVDFRHLHLPFKLR